MASLDYMSNYHDMVQIQVLRYNTDARTQSQMYIDTVQRLQNVAIDLNRLDDEDYIDVIENTICDMISYNIADRAVSLLNTMRITSYMYKFLAKHNRLNMLTAINPLNITRNGISILAEVACEFGYTQLVAWCFEFINKYFDVAKVQRYYKFINTAAERSAHYGHFDCVRVVYNYSGSFDSDCYKSALRYGNVDMINYVRARLQAPVPFTDKSVLGILLTQNHFELFKEHHRMGYMYAYRAVSAGIADNVSRHKDYQALTFILGYGELEYDKDDIYRILELYTSENRIINMMIDPSTKFRDLLYYNNIVPDRYLKVNVAIKRFMAMIAKKLATSVMSA